MIKLLNILQEIQIQPYFSLQKVWELYDKLNDKAFEIFDEDESLNDELVKIGWDYKFKGNDFIKPEELNHLNPSQLSKLYKELKELEKYYL